MVGMMFMIEDQGNWMRKVAGTCIGINMGLLLWGIFGDPGVKPATYLHYSKNWFSSGKDLYTSDSDELESNTETTNSDEEDTDSAKARQRKNTL